MKDHKLEGVPFIPTENMGEEIIPEAIVIHFTAGGSAQGAINTFINAGVSAHLILDREGKFTQMVPFNRKAWHAGVSEWQGRKYLNGWSIGIEIVNYGPLSPSGDHFVTRWGNTIHEKPFIGYHDNGSHEFHHWQFFTCKQLLSLKAALTLLKAEYDIHLLLGHDEVAPKRKIDPGPAFPWGLFRKEPKNLLYVKEKM